MLQPEEISEYRLLPLPAALDLLRKPIRRRVRAARRGTGPRYLEERPPGARRRALSGGDGSGPGRTA